MEDYGSAYTARRMDVDKLLSSTDIRTTAAAHLGGVAIECKLKALVAQYHSITSWGQQSCRPKDSRTGQPIERPGHSLKGSLSLMQVLYKKAKLDSTFLIHLSRVMHPDGPTERDFIDLRYSGDELAGNTFDAWKQSLAYVLGWLEKNG